MILKFIRNNFSSLQGPARTLAELHFLDSIGNGLFFSGSVIYFVTVTKLPSTAVGAGLSLAGLGGFISSVLFGMVADRIGARRLLITLLTVLAGCYALYPAVRSVLIFLPFIMLVGALQFGCGPAFGSLIMSVVPEPDRVAARAAMRSLFNTGFGVGALAAAGFISAGGLMLQFLPIGNALSFVAAALLAGRLPRPIVRTGGGPGKQRFRVLRDIAFLRVVGSSSLLALHTAVLLVGIPLWVVTHSHLPHVVVPLILVVNTVLVALLQVTAAKSSETLNGAVRASVRSGLVSVVACALLARGEFAGGWWIGVAVVLAVPLFTVAELWQSASGFGLAFGLAPESARGEYLGAFQLHIVVQATVGPAVVASLVASHGHFGWLAIALIFVIGTLTIGPAVRRATPTAPEGLRSAQATD